MNIMPSLLGGAMPLSINALMRHLRKPPISMRVNGSRQKRDLRNIGYYHGYKGYRFIHRSNERIALDDFDQLKRIYDFDMSLKTLIYPQIMFVETALKNRVLEATLEDAKSEVFEVIFTTSMTAYREKQGKQYRSHRENVWVHHAALPGSATSRSEHLSITSAMRLSTLRKP